MDFAFDETEIAFQDAVRRYAKEVLAKDYRRWDSGEILPREKISELAQLGVNGLLVPEEYGGSGSSYVLAGIAAEEIARGDHNFTYFVQLGAIAADLICRYGTETIKRTVLPKIASGESIVAFALTEPGAGSDAAAIKLTATLDNKEWVINGEKASISMAGLADHCVAFARIEGKEIGAIIIPLDRPGVTRRVYDSVGSKLTQRGSLHFDSVRVGVGNRLGSGSSGFAQAMEAFDYNRAIIALACIGTAQQSLDETVDYAKQRTTHPYVRQIPCAA